MSPSKPLRLFTALWPDDALRASLVQWQSSWDWPTNAALVEPDNLHVTLHFLGDVRVDRVPALRGALHLAWDPFTLRLGRAEVWGNGVAVLLPHGTPAALRDLHARMARAVTGAGLVVESRPYKPHVTLARRASHARPPSQELSCEWTATSGFVLVQSPPGGGRYMIVDRFGG
jgi:2'-5' RNA ligase